MGRRTCGGLTERLGAGLQSRRHGFESRGRLHHVFRCQLHTEDAPAPAGAAHIIYERKGLMRTRIRDGVVVLNASFEPLGIVPVARAVTFLMRERATLVDAIPGRVIRSADAEMPFPRVVQFREMIRVPYRYGVQPWTRQGLLQRDNYECAYCATGRRASTVDHIMPRSRVLRAGGNPDTWTNTVAACSRCNGIKADRTPEEAGMPLRFQPRIVTTRDSLVVAIAETGADLAMLGLAAG